MEVDNDNNNISSVVPQVGAREGRMYTTLLLTLFWKLTKEQKLYALLCLDSNMAMIFEDPFPQYPQFGHLKIDHGIFYVRYLSRKFR